jgi:hypothetical protein
MDRLPDGARIAPERKPRRKVLPVRLKCMRPGCENVPVFTSEAAAYRHADAHGGGRLECVTGREP